MIESTYAKLFQSILTSSVWQEDDATRLVWITMLALKNRFGEVAGSVPGIAHAAKVPLDAARSAIAKLLAPDPDSRTKDHEGRRIVAIDGGWRVLNHEVYRQAMNEDERRAYKARWARQNRQSKGKRGQDEDKCGSKWTHTDADTKEAPKKPKKQQMNPRTTSPVSCNHVANVHLCEGCAPDLNEF